MCELWSRPANPCLHPPRPPSTSSRPSARSDDRFPAVGGMDASVVAAVAAQRAVPLVRLRLQGELHRQLPGRCDADHLLQRPAASVRRALVRAGRRACLPVRRRGRRRRERGRQLRPRHDLQRSDRVPSPHRGVHVLLRAPGRRPGFVPTVVGALVGAVRTTHRVLPRQDDGVARAPVVDGAGDHPLRVPQLGPTRRRGRRRGLLPVVEGPADMGGGPVRHRRGFQALSDLLPRATRSRAVGQRGEARRGPFGVGRGPARCWPSTCRS